MPGDRIRQPISRRNHQAVRSVKFDFLVTRQYRQGILKTSIWVGRDGSIYAIFARQMKQNTLQITGASTGAGLGAIDGSQVNRRSDRFSRPLIIAPAEMLEACASRPQVLEANYRKTVWANRVAASKVQESQKAEVFAGMIYERNGGRFEMFDVLAEDQK